MLSSVLLIDMGGKWAPIFLRALQSATGPGSGASLLRAEQDGCNPAGVYLGGLADGSNTSAARQAAGEALAVAALKLNAGEDSISHLAHHIVQVQFLSATRYRAEPCHAGCVAVTDAYESTCTQPGLMLHLETGLRGTCHQRSCLGSSHDNVST